MQLTTPIINSKITLLIASISFTKLILYLIGVRWGKSLLV